MYTEECTINSNIFSIAWILNESWIDPMFFKLAGMGWFELVWLGSTWIESEYFWFQFRIKLVWFQFTEFLLPTFQLWNDFRAQHFWNFFCLWGFPLNFHFHFSFSYATEILCRQDPTSWLTSQRCRSCSIC